MQQVFSKEVTALYPGGQLLQKDYFDSIFNADPYDQKEPGERHRSKKNTFDFVGLGSNDRGHNPGAGTGLGRDPNESKDRSIGSGYNDGGQADDEIGPGNTSTTPDPYYVPNVYNELFLERWMQQGNADSVRKHLKDVLKGKPTVVPHTRYQVTY